MIVPFAKAIQGFIPVVDTPNLLNTDNFLQCLQKIMVFENIDIQDFDGNTCRIISSEDPTNSIFIYTNDTGTYLYQVVSASPFLHKNKKIWLCDTYEMEDVGKINDILTRNTKVVVYKNLRYKHGSSGQEPFEKITVKGNFKAREQNYSSLYGNVLCLKIKCLTNPTTLILKSTALDGSFNFFFPMRIQTNSNGDQCISQVIRLSTDTTQAVSISEIISKYSPNIKSIEVLPFVPSEFRETLSSVASGRIYNITDYGTGQVTVSIQGSATWTDCGIFLPQGHTNCGERSTAHENFKYFFNKELIQGGGARGFLRTPLGNIELNFADCNSNTQLDSTSIDTILLDDGWKIDGAVKATVPPHYINFYTDNAGQMFIQNLTTNAQELRSLERQNIAKQEEQQYAYEHKQQLNVTNTIGAVASNAFSGNFFGTLGAVAQGAVNSYANYVENEFERGKIERDYGRSLAEYRDKISTQSLLASLTGKQISGNVSLTEFIYQFKMNYFQIFIETNFSLQFLENTTPTKYSFLTQPDYDYSTEQLPCSNSMNEGETTNPDCLYKKGSITIQNLLRNLFGYTGGNNRFLDEVGVSYSVTFGLENIILNNSDASNLKFSKILNFPIRRNKKIIPVS